PAAGPGQDQAGHAAPGDRRLSQYLRPTSGPGAWLPLPGRGTGRGIMKLIDGEKLKQLKQIPDERGFLMETLLYDDDVFEKLVQVYLTVAYPGVVKGWHYHKRQTDHFVCVKGNMKVVLYDGRDDSPTKGLVNEFFIGEHNPMLVVIPNFVLHGM